MVTDKGRYLSKTVIIAAGLGAFKPRSLGRPGIDRFEGKGVYYAVREKDFFKGKDIVIAGGGDSAFDWAIKIDDSRVKVGQNLETNRRGIFAVGDIANYPGKLKLILTGFSDGAQVVRSTVPYFRPGDKIRHVHSTSSRLFSR